MRVSIIMAVYNGEKHLCAQLESIRNQTVLPYELIAIDDCSTDSSAEILKKIAKNAPFSVKIIKNQRNMGGASKFSCGQVFGLGMKEKSYVSAQIEDLESRISLLKEEIGLSDLCFVKRLRRILSFYKSQRLPHNKSGVLRSIKDLFYPIMRR